ncbi:MAG: PAS domain S-box protein [Bacteroidota bacterium]
MKVKIHIRIKLIIAVLAVTAIVFWASVAFLNKRVERFTRTNIYEYIDATSKAYTNQIKGEFDKQFSLARAMTYNFYDIDQRNSEDIKLNTTRLLKNTAESTPDFLSVWTSWELWAIEKKWDKPFGRERYTYLRDNNELKQIVERLNETGDNTSSLYFKLKTEKREALVDPYWYTYTGGQKKVLETSVCVPLVVNNKFAALFGFDIELSVYQEMIRKLKPYEGSYAILISNNGTIVAHPDSTLLGALADTVLVNGKQILEGIASKGKYSEIVQLEKEKYYTTFNSFSAGKASEKWSLGILVPDSIINQQIAAITGQVRVVMIIGLIVLAIVIWIIAFSITNPLVKATKILGDLSLGKIDPAKKIDIKTGDEIEDIASSINILIDSLYKTSQFAKEIGKGNLQAKYSKLSDEDVLGDALMEMRKSLEYAKKIDEERKQEESKNKWYNEGMAKFAEILRHNTSNLNDFAYEAIRNLTKYVDATIGAVFLVNNDNPNDIYLELMATYAYERRKYEEKIVRMGEGLVGRCAQEAETIYMTEIPKGYVKIASGLGEDEPTVLLLVPMKINDEVHGVIEIASFEPIEDYKIKFIEKIGENFAATISSVKINIRTAKLLEESRIKSEELASQEEEMRQNMEELQATQEESARKSAEMESLINALHSSSYVIEYDLNGNIISVNEAYLNLTGQTEKDIVGTHHADNLEMTSEQKNAYQRFWQDLRNGMIKKETSKVKIGGKTYTFIETYSPILDENRRVVKILKIAHNITDFIDESSEGKPKKK